MIRRAAPRRLVRAVAAAAAAAVLASCASSGDRGGAASGQAGPPAAVGAAAQAYQRAILGHHWELTCGAETARARHGDSVARCIELAGPDPDRGSTIPVSVDTPLPVPATGTHPAGWAVATRHTVTEPGREPYEVVMAVRVVDDAGTWRIDQYEPVDGADPQLSPHPAVAALLGGDRR